MPIKDKVAAAVYMKQWRKDHAETERKRANARNLKLKKELREFVQSFKDKPCTDCKVQYPSHVMDFDHLEGTEKKGTISRIWREFWSKKRILEEVAKCEIVCANCHRDRTYKRMRSKLA